MKRNDSLIKGRVYKYMLTGILTTVALQLGNVVDAMIVGNLIGSIGNSAVNASLPYVYILQAAAILLSSGGAVTAAVLLGKRDARGAGRVMGFCLAAGFVYTLLFLILSPVIVPFFVGLTGAEGQLKSMITDIAFIYSFGMPLVSIVIETAFFMNVDNHPGLAAKVNISANVINLAFDWFLVRFTPLGIRGAALSTVIGYVMAGLIFIPVYAKSADRVLTPVLRGMKEAKPMIGSALKRGLPDLTNLVMTVIGMSVLNAAVLHALGSGYFSAYSVANNTLHIVQMFLNGISSVIATVGGVLYGEGDFFGMRSVFRRVLSAALISCAVITAAFLAVPQVIVRMYGFDVIEVMPDLMTGLRIFSLSFVAFTLNAVSQNYYRTIGLTALSTASCALELLIIKVPLMVYGMSRFGFSGLFGAVVVSELLTFGILNIVRLIMHKAGRIQYKGFMAIPENNGSTLELTIRGSNPEAVDAAREIMEYCRKESISDEEAAEIRFIVEEIAANIGKYGYDSADGDHIDISIAKAGGNMTLRFRDNGTAFDPVSYEPENSGDYPGGLGIVKKMPFKISYMRVLELNNTIVDIR